MPPRRKDPIVIAREKLGASIDALQDSVVEALKSVLDDYDDYCAAVDGDAVEPEPVSKQGPRAVPSRTAAAPPKVGPGRPRKPAPVEDDLDDIDGPEPEEDDFDEPEEKPRRGRPAAATKPAPKPAGKRGRPAKPPVDEDDDFGGEEEEEPEDGEESWDEWGEEEEEPEPPRRGRPARR